MNSFAPRRNRRQGFSLVELLVVLGIISVIAAIGIFATRPFQSRASVNNGAVLLQSWLTVAKQRALFFQKPCGLRLLPGDEIADNSGNAYTTMVTKCVYIQQQDDIYGVGVYHANYLAAPNGPRTLTTATALPISLSAADKAYIEVNGGLIYSIGSASGTTINLTSLFPLPIPQSANASYRIYRSPAVLTGTTDIADLATEEVLKMPRGSCIIIGANAAYSSTVAGTGLTPPNPPIDIIFGPDGSVSVPAINADKIMLWVTSTQKGADGTVDPKQGQPSLVVVVTRTGYVAGYNVDTVSANPYSQVP